MAKVKTIPEGYHTLTPYMTVRGADQAIEFYKKAFGAEERYRLAGRDGKVIHAELRIGDSIFMLGEESPQMGNTSPQTLNGTASGVMIYCKDTDEAVQRAVQAGAKVTLPAQDMFWGDRYAKVLDPYGHDWSLGTHIEDVSPEEMKKRWEVFSATAKAGC
jgi:PhnB protein